MADVFHFCFRTGHAGGIPHPLQKSRPFESGKGYAGDPETDHPRLPCRAKGVFRRLDAPGIGPYPEQGLRVAQIVNKLKT